MNDVVRFHAARLGLQDSYILTAQSVKHAYHRLALKWHPDKCTDPKANGKFRDICESYQWFQKNSHVLGKDRSSAPRPYDLFNHTLCIRMLIHYMKQGLLTIQNTIHTTKWHEIATLFGLDMCMVQQYGIFIQQHMNIPITFTVYVAPRERKKTFVNRCLLLQSDANRSIPIHIVANLDTNDIILIPPEDVPPDVNALVDMLDVHIVDRSEL